MGQASNQFLISIVDDDESVRESLPDLLMAQGFTTTVFASAEEFLASGAVEKVRCLILDVGLPGMSGPALHRQLLSDGLTLPVIFITAQMDRNLPASLLAQGAVACLFKPFSEPDLRAALNAALPAR